MASYDAQINLLISGQRELERLSGRLRSIEKQIIDINRLGVSPQQRDPITGRFGADPDRQNRIRLAGIQRIAKEEERRARFTSARLRSQNSELERSILLQSRLNSAVDLYTTNLDKFSRGGGGARLGESLQSQIRDIKAAYEAATAGGTKNLSIVRSLGTELGRIVERQNEINRLSSFQSKAFYDTQRFERRMAELRTAGAPASAFGGVGRQIRELRSAQARGSQFEASDFTRRIKESLDRIARELEATTRQARIENTARIAARSWEKFFEDANINARRLEQNQKDAVNKFRNFFEDAANQALEIRQNAKDTRRSWQNFFEDAQKEADRLRGERLSRFARLRGRPEQYATEAGPLPYGGPGSPRYFKEAQQLAGQLLDVENEIGKIRQESLSESLRLETERLSLAEKRRQKEAQIRDVLLEAVTFGRGSQIKRAASDIATGGRNALVRGGLGLGALGIGGAYTAVQQATGNIDLGMLQGPATQAAAAIGGAINNALGGVPGLINDMLSALGNVPSALGLATVAALAFGPAMKTAGDAVFLAGKKFGESKFGENIKLTLDRQTNLFESVINKASEMNMVLDASRSGLDAVGKKIETLPALPAAGQTAFQGEIRRGRGGAFMGGGAREITNPEFLATAAGTMAQRTQEAAQTSLMFAEGLGQAANEAKTIAEYLRQANELRAKGESSAQRFVRQTIERGRALQQDQASAELTRQRSAFLTGSQYSLAQVPARGELLPGGRTETRQPDYREMLNNIARVSQLQQKILDAMSKQQGFAATIGQIERRTINDKGKSLQIQQEENVQLQRSVQIIRERNKELRQRPIAAMTPQERVTGGILDPASLAASRRQRVERGRARQESIRRAASEGLIGGAFPLLFGQGIGAAALGGAGGALGGFAGGGLGFGLSLVGTALGTAFDTAVQGAIELGAALEKPVENFDQLAEKSFFSSKALEDTIRKTIEYGDTATVSALIQKEAIKKLGVGGVQNLKVLGTESDRLNRAFAELGQQMQAVAAGPLASVIGFFANIAGQAAAAGRVRLLRANLNEQQAGQFNKEILGRLKERGIQRGFFAPSTPTESEVGMLAQQGALQDIVDKWQAIQIKGQIKIDPKQRIESEINALEKQLEAMDIGKPLLDQVRSANREQEDLDKQRADLVRSYEESIGNIRKQVEDEIRNKRFATLEKENQLLDAQGQIRLKQLQIANRAAVAQAGVGERPEVEQAAKEVAQLVAQFTEQQLSAEEEAASIKRNAALEVQKIDSEAAQFKVNIEKEVSRLNIETARRVADINEQVRRRNEENDSRRFDIERDIAVLRLKLVQDELALATRNAELPLEARQEAFKLYKEVDKRRRETEALSAPRGLRGVGAIGGGGVSTAGLDRAAADYRAAVENYVAAQLRLNELDVVKNAQEFALGIAEFANKTDATLAAIQTREADAEIERLRYIELVNAGLTDTVAQKVIELETTKRVALAVYDTAIAQLESKIVAEATTDQVKEQNKAYQDQIDILKKRKDALEGKFGEVDTATGKGTGAIGGAIESDRGKKIQDFIAQTKAELNDLEAVAIRVSQGIGDAVGDSLANGITGLIEGTTTAKEIFAGFLKDVGQILIREGTRMIAMYIAIGIAKQFAGFLSSGVSGGAGGAGASDLPTAITSTSPIAANGAYFANGIAAFAKGGMFTNSVVSSPTLFQFADGGVTRTGLMGEAGPEAIMPLKRGADGKLGVAVTENRALLNSASDASSTPSSADELGSTESATAAARASIRETERLRENRTQIMMQQSELERRYERERIEQMASTPGKLDIKYESQVINNVEYVTRDQAERMAAQSAIRGRELALSSLQNSVKTRKRVGMS